MIEVLLSVAAAAFALAEPAPAAATRLLEAQFAPLNPAERAYSRLGPTGPFYPAQAADAGLNGVAILECDAGSEGVLAKCVVASETPASQHFGAAARVMAQRRHVRVAATTPEGSRVRVRVPFVLGGPK